MILNRLTMENFRSFFGEQTIEFASNKIKNTTIIYALNGVGKTNLLNAILWCLHGTFTAGFRNSDDVLNWEAKRRGRKSYHVSLEFEEDGNKYVVKRSGGDTTNFKIFLIEDDGNYVEVKSSTLFVNSIIPKDMAGYFINDGEGDDLVVDSNGCISIRRSIRDILGFRVAEKTIEDLNKIKNEIRQELKRFDKDKELAEIENRIQVFDESIQNTSTSLIENKSALETYEDRLGSIEKQLGASSTAVVDQLISSRNNAESRLYTTERLLSKLEARKIDLIREYSWVAFAKKLCDEGLNFIDESELKGKLPAPFNTQLVKDILQKQECICGACVEPGTEAFDKINSLLDQAADPHLLNRLQRARSTLTTIKENLRKAQGNITDTFQEIRGAQDLVRDLKNEIEDLSNKIIDLDDEQIRSLEKERNRYKRNIRETERTIDRLDYKLKDLEKRKAEIVEQAQRIKGLSPRAKVLKAKIDLIENVIQEISIELKHSEDSIYETIKDKINAFLDRYLRQDYRVSITKDFKINLQDRNGTPVPPSGGQGAILSFIYISSLISIARERRDLDSSILTPGAIAPLVFDAPFSKLDPKYAPNVAKVLPDLVDQLIILMYQDDGKNVTETLRETGRLGKEYYLLEEIAGEQGDNEIYTLDVKGVKIPLTTYNSGVDRVIVKEVCADAE